MKRSGHAILLVIVLILFLLPLANPVSGPFPNHSRNDLPEQDELVIIFAVLKEQKAYRISRDVWGDYSGAVDELNHELKEITGNITRSLREIGEKEFLQNPALYNKRIEENLTLEDIETWKGILEKFDMIRTQARNEIYLRCEKEGKENQESITDFISNNGGKIIDRGFLLNYLMIEIPENLLPKLQKHEDVAFLELPAISWTDMNVSVPSTGAETLWNEGITGGVQDIAVLDTGIDKNHPAFSGHEIIEEDFTEDGTPDDTYSHGTHVAGIISSTDSIYRGVAYGHDKLFNAKCVFSTQQAKMNGGDWSINQPGGGDGADVISTSFGVGGEKNGNSALTRYFDAVVDSLGVPVTNSAGNNGPNSSTLSIPADGYNLMTAGNGYDRGTTDPMDDYLVQSSSRGPTTDGRKKPDLTAPGTHVISCNNDWETENDWISKSGTSMSSPLIAGSILLLMDYSLTDFPARYKALLMNTAIEMGDPGMDNRTGAGYMDLDHAYYHRDDVFEEVIDDSPGYVFFKGPLSVNNRATLVWQRHLIYNDNAAPETFYDLSNLDLYTYDESDGSTLNVSNSLIDSIEMSKATRDCESAVYKVKLEGDMSGVDQERFALATEEDFIKVTEPELDLDIQHPDTVEVGEEFYIWVNISNTGGLRAHDIQIQMNIPTSLELLSGNETEFLSSLDGSNGTFPMPFLVEAAEPTALEVSASISSNCYGESFSKGPIYADITPVDTTPPLAPGIFSNSHSDPELNYSIDDAHLGWNETHDNHRIEGYNYVLDHSELTIPPEDLDNSLTDTLTFTALDDGEWFFHLRAVDETGNWGDTAHFRLGVDTSILAPVNLTSIPEEWSKDPVFDVFWQNPRDVSGITGAYYKTNVEPAFEEDGIRVEKWNLSFIENINVQAEGVNPIYVWLQDDAGNVDHTAYSITELKYDPTPPSAPERLFWEGGSYSNSTILHPSWDEVSDICGIDVFQLQVFASGDDPSSVDITSISSENNMTGAALNISGDFRSPDTIRFRLRAVNGAGSTGAWSDVSPGIMLDTDPPETKIHELPEYVNKPEILLNYTAMDGSGSGVAGVVLHYRRMGEMDWISGDELQPTGNLLFQNPGNGVFQIWIQSFDKAGNRESKDIFTVHELMVDTKAPVIEANSTEYGWFSKDPGDVVDIDFFSRGGSPLQELYYSQDIEGSGELLLMDVDIPYNADQFTEDWDLPWEDMDEGENSVIIRLVDMAGNYAEREIIFKKDTGPPSLIINNEPSHLREDNIELEWRASDGISGVYQVWIELDSGDPVRADELSEHSLKGLENGKHSVVIRVEDEAGNSYQAKIEFTVDTGFFSFSGPYYGIPSILLMIIVIALMIVFPLLYFIRKRKRREDENGEDEVSSHDGNMGNERLSKEVEFSGADTDETQIYPPEEYDQNEYL